LKKPLKKPPMGGFVAIISWRAFSILYITPEQRRNGEDVRLFALRNETLHKAFLHHPERFPKGGPKTWKVQRVVYLNPSNETKKIIHKKGA